MIESNESNETVNDVITTPTTSQPLVAPVAPPTNLPNVKLASSRKSEALTKGPLNIGMHKAIDIPDEASQLSGFYVEEPSILINQFPQYKYLKAKGQ